MNVDDVAVELVKLQRRSVPDGHRCIDELKIPDPSRPRGGREKQTPAGITRQGCLHVDEERRAVYIPGGSPRTMRL